MSDAEAADFAQMRGAMYSVRSGSSMDEGEYSPEMWASMAKGSSSTSCDAITEASEEASRPAAAVTPERSKSKAVSAVTPEMLAKLQQAKAEARLGKIKAEMNTSGYASSSSSSTDPMTVPTYAMGTPPGTPMGLTVIEPEIVKMEA